MLSRSRMSVFVTDYGIVGQRETRTQNPPDGTAYARCLFATYVVQRMYGVVGVATSLLPPIWKSARTLRARDKPNNLLI